MLGIRFTILFLIMAIISYGKAGNDMFNPCQPNSTSNATGLPELPLQFTAVINASFLHKNTTFTIREYYDYNEDEMVMEFNQIKQIINVKENTHSFINLTSKTCTVSSLDNPFADGFDVNGNHIQGTVHILHFGRQFGETFVGKAEINGQKSKQWQFCAKTNQSNYLVDYYFTDEEKPKPLRCEVKGTIRYQRNNSVAHTESFFHHIYDFVIFNASKPDKSVYKPPQEVVCSFPKQLKLPTIPDQMMYAVEYRNINTTDNSVRHAKVYYDYINQVFRSDHYLRNDKGGWMPVTEIQSETYGLQFLLRSPTNCEISPLKKKIFDGEYIDDHLNLKHAFIHLKENPDSYGYTENCTVRGIDADVWTMKSENLLDASRFTKLQWYFSKKSVPMISSKSMEQVPLRIVGYHDNSSILFTIDLFHFDDGSHLQESINLPMRQCFQLGSSLYTLTFFMSDPSQKHMEKLTDQTDIVDTLRTKFAQIAKVNSSRISVELVTAIERIDVRLYILGWPKVDVEKPKNFVEAEDIAKTLKSLILNNKITVQYTNSQEDTILYNATFKQGFFDGVTWEYYLLDKNYVSHPDCTQKGAIAGVALACFVFGLLVMCILVHLLLKRRGYNLRTLLKSYARFDDKKSDGEENRNREVETNENRL